MEKPQHKWKIGAKMLIRGVDRSGFPKRHEHKFATIVKREYVDSTGLTESIYNCKVQGELAWFYEDELVAPCLMYKKEVVLLK
jgi:hypothetical protein